MATFTRLVRFLAPNSHIYYGEAVLPTSTSNILSAKFARIITGDVFSPTYTISPEQTPIKKLLCPLAPEHARSVRCLGLNYARHAKESNMAVPTYPVLFYKPSTSLAGPTDTIPVPVLAQEADDTVDYECELVAVIGKQCRDVSEADALSYVLGYAVGNDVSHRTWQLQRGGGQWNLGKGFDGWAPFGPGIVAPSLIADPNALRICTRVNGAEVQRSSTADMIFGVARTISFLSQGVTLVPGDIIFTGTPEGVGMGRTPKLWLRDGDVVEVELEGVGTCRNEVKFEKERAKL